MRRLLNILIAIDQLIFCLITLGDSNPDETMSAAAWRLEKEGYWQGKLFRPLIDFIFFFQKDHCKKSARAEQQNRIYYE